MNVKVKIEGEELDHKIPFRTTETLRDVLLAESMRQGASMNMVLNKVLLQWAKKTKFYPKPKK